MDGELIVYVLIEYDIINSVEFGWRNFLKYGFALLKEYLNILYICILMCNKVIYEEMVDMLGKVDLLLINCIYMNNSK